MNPEASSDRNSEQECSKNEATKELRLSQVDEAKPQFVRVRGESFEA